MDEAALFNELCRLLRRAGTEIRVETFHDPPASAGGLCRLQGKNLVLLHAGASKPEQARALLDVVERMGPEALGIQQSELSAPLLAALVRRGQLSTPTPARAAQPRVGTVGPVSAPVLELVRGGHPLADYTTMGVGGPATRFELAATESELMVIARDARDAGQALYPLGGGSNVVVADEGVKGTVVRVALRGITLEYDNRGVLVTAAAGESWHDFAADMTGRGLAGVECLGGIPGQVGSTPIQNVGAYGQEVATTIHAVRALHRKTLELREFSGVECEFGYRESVFKRKLQDTYVVLSVTYRLVPNAAPTTRYAELNRVLGERSREPSLQEVFDTVVDLRRQKSMVLDPTDVNARSAGSFFVNCQLSSASVDRIAGVAGERPPAFLMENGLYKVPSAWLIEQSGLTKGFRRGNMGLSTKHTLCVVAHRGARARDVIEFSWYIRDIVEERFGVRLIPEPLFWGFPQLVDGLPALPRGPAGKIA